MLPPNVKMQTSPGNAAPLNAPMGVAAPAPGGQPQAMPPGAPAPVSPPAPAAQPPGQQPWIGQQQFPWQGDPNQTLQMDPGYQFRLQEGEKAIRRNAAAGSGVHSGATLKAMKRYGQQMGSQEYAASRNRAMQDYMQQRTQGIQDYQMQVDEQMRNYNLYKDSRAMAYQDQAYLDSLRQQELDQYLTLAGFGAQGTNAAINTGLQIGGLMSNAGQYGIEGYGAGQQGAAQAGIQQQKAINQANQQNFNNLMAIGELGLDTFSAFNPLPTG